jgi:hypothetical protein
MCTLQTDIPTELERQCLVNKALLYVDAVYNYYVSLGGTLIKIHCSEENYTVLVHPPGFARDRPPQKNVYARAQIQKVTGNYNRKQEYKIC